MRRRAGSRGGQKGTVSGPGMMLGRFLVIAFLAIFMTAADRPRLATAGDMTVATRLLTPPKGRLHTRKRLMDPSLPGSMSSGRRYGADAFIWFWNEVSPARSDADTRRWSDVLEVIENARAKGKAIFGSRSNAERILDAYGDQLTAEADRLNISLPLLVAVIEVESNGNPQARSSRGAGGLMQLMPDTAERFGVTDAYAPSQNIRGGAQYLDWLLRYFSDDAVLALAGYNAGEGAVVQYAGVPPYGETRNYIAKVAGAWATARRLCVTPPMSVRDDCDLK